MWVYFNPTDADAGWSAQELGMTCPLSVMGERQNQGGWGSHLQVKQGRVRRGAWWWRYLRQSNWVEAPRGKQGRCVSPCLPAEAPGTHLEAGILGDSKTGCHKVDKPWRGCQDPRETLFRQRRSHSPFRFTSAQMRCRQEWKIGSSCAHWCQKPGSVVCLTPLRTGTHIHACPRREEDSACHWAAKGWGL